MFDTLSTRFDGILKRLRGKGRLTEADVDEVLARDPHRPARGRRQRPRRAPGRRPHPRAGDRRSSCRKALDPEPAGRQDRQQRADRTSSAARRLKITYASRPPTVVLMAGLQGSGKTTNSAKLARWFKRQGRNPLLVGADLQRPAAVEQLRTLGRQIDVPVFSEPGDPGARTGRREGLAEARRLGRTCSSSTPPAASPIDAEMMEQVRQISDVVEPDYTFLVIDAMTGQDAVGVAEAFHETLRHRRRDPVQARRRRPRRRRALRQGGHRPADRLRLAPARSSTPSSSSTPTAWPGASSAWATCSASSSRPSRPSRRTRPSRPRPKLLEGRVHARRLPRADAARSRRWARCRSLIGMMPGMPEGAEGRRDRRRRAQAGSRRSSAR